MSLDLNALDIRLYGASLFAPLTCSIPPGQITTIMGPSGAGKSTLLDAIAGHLDPSFSCTGDVMLNGQRLNDIAPHRRRIGLMFQDAVLLPHLSVGDNLAFGLPAHIKTGRARRASVETALQQAGLAGMFHRDPATLSGGERARAALMRSLLAQPQALLLDEPFSKLDSSLRSDMRAFAFDHIRAHAIPALMVTHDEQDAKAAAGKIIHLSARP